MTRTVLALIAALLALPAAAQAAPQGSTLLQSGPSGLDPFPTGLANESSASRFAISADGCKVVFDSMSDGIVSGDSDGYRNVYLRDACADTTVLVSRATGATGAAANNSSYSATISPNGRYVAFLSIAGNLGAATTSNGVFVRDLQTNATIPVSRATGSTGTLAGHQGEAPAVSNDGKVVFGTTAKLDDADLNGTLDTYVGDGTTTTLVSRNDAGAAGAIMGGAISADGTAVGFITAAKLSTADTNSTSDAYVRKGGANVLVSRRTGADGSAAAHASRLALSADGSAVAFETNNDLDPKDTNTNGDVYHRAGDVTTLVSRPDGAGTQALTLTNSSMPVIDAAGTTAGFVSDGTGFTADATAAGNDVFLRSVATDTTRLVSRVAPDGTGAGETTLAALSGEGAHVATLTKSDTVLDGDADDFAQVVRHRVSDGAGEHVSRPTGEGTWTTAGVNAASAGRDAVSADGRYVAFVSGSDGIAGGDRNASRNAFVRDNRTNTTTQVNLTDADAPATGGDATEVAMSDDGRTVAIVTTERLDPELDKNDLTDVYVRDRVAGTTTLASRITGAQAAVAGGYSVKEVSISGDGRRIAFVTGGRLDAADVAIGTDDVYVRDLVSGDTFLASRNASGGAANSGAKPALDFDGSRVAYETDVKVVPSDVGPRDVYVRDLATQTTHLASRENGAEGAGAVLMAWSPSISGDGNRVTFQTYATNLSDGATNGHLHVHVRDLATNETQLVSRTAGNEQGVGPSENGVISADGTHVAFETRAAILDGPGGYTQVVVKDLVDGSVTRATAPHGATTFPQRDSSVAAISGNGSCVAFTSTANVTPATHVPGDFAQVFLRSVEGECPDATAPQTTITEKPDVRVGTQDVEFAYTSSEAGSTFECRQDAGDWYPCGTNATWDGAAEGAHVFAARATDAAGNVDASPAEAAFHVDLSTPETAIDTAPAPRVNVTTVTIAFSGSDDAFFRCRLDGAAWEDCDPPSMELTGLTEGEHTFEVQAYDYVGHEDATPAKAVFTVDTTAPETTITAKPGARVATQDVAFAPTSSEGGDTFQCRQDAGEWYACGAAPQWTGASEGAHVFAVRAVDAAGNVDGSPAEASFFVDLTAPETTIDAVPAPRVNVTTVTIGFGGSDDASFRCRLDGAPWEGCAAPSEELTGLTEGEHTFEVQAYDAVGHVDATPAKAVFTIDTTGPVTTIDSVTATDAGVMDAVFSAEAGTTLRCAVDAGELEPCASPLRRTGLAAGAHKLRVQATDDLGNAGPIVEKAFQVPAKPVVEDPDKPQPEQPKPSQDGGTTGGGTTTTTTTGEAAPAPAPGGGSVPAPRSAPAGVAAKIVKTTVKSGVAIVTLSCPASAKAGCKGAVALSAKKLGVVARGSYAVKAGKRVTLRLKLKGKAKKAKRVTARAA